MGVAIVDGGLENLHLLAGDLGAAQPADQLLGLAAVHASDDDLDPAGGGVGRGGFSHGDRTLSGARASVKAQEPHAQSDAALSPAADRKSTRLNSSHLVISYA